MEDRWLTGIPFGDSAERLIMAHENRFSPINVASSVGPGKVVPSLERLQPLYQPAKNRADRL